MVSTAFGTMVQDIIDRVATITGTKVNAVSKGSQRFAPTNLPIALVSVGRMTSEPMEMGDEHYVEVPIEVVVVIRDTSPTDWLTDVISPLGNIVDALFDDRTLNGKCEDSYLTYCEPARLTLSGEGAGNKIYYGGLIGYLAKAFYRA